MRATLGLDTDGVTKPAPDRVADLSLIAAGAQLRIDELRSMAEPDREGNDELLPSEAWARLIGRERQSFVQPPEPPLPVSPRAPGRSGP